MAELLRIHPCDGACCREKPLRRIVTAQGQDCSFRDPDLPDRGCRIMAGHQGLEVLTPSEIRRFKEACLEWPQNATPETQASWGGCCWRFKRDGD